MNQWKRMCFLNSVIQSLTKTSSLLYSHKRTKIKWNENIFFFMLVLSLYMVYNAHIEILSCQDRGSRLKANDEFGGKPKVRLHYGTIYFKETPRIYIFNKLFWVITGSWQAYNNMKAFHQTHSEQQYRQCVQNICKYWVFVRCFNWNFIKLFCIDSKQCIRYLI